MRLLVLLAFAAIPYQTGSASYYALDGHHTASGKLFRSGQMMAAHRTLPFGTWLEVRRCDQRASVVVQVVDRGPFTKNRIIDLSPAAFKKLDKLNSGVTCVHIHRKDKP